MFNVVIQFEHHREIVPCSGYKEALDRKEFESERYPDAVVSIEPGF